MFVGVVGDGSLDVDGRDRNSMLFAERSFGGSFLKGAGEVLSETLLNIATRSATDPNERRAFCEAVKQEKHHRTPSDTQNSRQNC